MTPPLGAKNVKIRENHKKKISGPPGVPSSGSPRFIDVINKGPSTTLFRSLIKNLGALRGPLRGQNMVKVA